MADIGHHCRVVLNGILPSARDVYGRRDLLDRAQQVLTQDHFPDHHLRVMWILIARYADVTGAVMTRTALGDMVRGQDAGTRSLYEETYDALTAEPVDEGEFAWSLDQVRELAAERSTGEALTRAMEIYRIGVTDERGEQLRGHEDARVFVLEALGQVDQALSTQMSPEGDMRTEADSMLADYAERKRSRLSGALSGILFGVPELDGRVGGFHNGELDLLAGYTSSGKTTLCVQLGWSAAVEQGKNVVILTTETLRQQVMRKLIARHSRLDAFGLSEGLNTRDLKAGTLPEELEPVYQQVWQDFSRNPGYGRCYVAQVPRGATLATCEQRLYRIQRQFNIELVIIDYLRLLKSERKRQSDREELGAIIVEAKQLATTFDNGRGVPVVSPWQVNRSQHENATKAGFYTTAALAESAEASNTADVIISLLQPAEVEGRYAELRAAVLKNRDGETGSSFALTCDYATSAFFGEGGGFVGHRDPAALLADEDFLNI